MYRGGSEQNTRDFRLLCTSGGEGKGGGDGRGLHVFLCSRIATCAVSAAPEQQPLLPWRDPITAAEKRHRPPRCYNLVSTRLAISQSPEDVAASRWRAVVSRLPHDSSVHNFLAYAIRYDGVGGSSWWYRHKMQVHTR